MNRGHAASHFAAVSNGMRKRGPLGVAETARCAARGVPASVKRDPTLTIVTAIALGALTFEAVHPALVRNPTLHATLETAMTLLAVAGAILFTISFTYSRRLSDVLLAAGALTIGLTYLSAYAFPLLAHSGLGDRLSDAAVWGAAFAAAAFSAANRNPDRAIDGGLRRPILLAAVSAGAIVLAAVLALVVGGALLGGSVPGHWLVVVLAVTGAALFVDAAIASFRPAAVGGGGSSTLLPAALILLAAVQLTHLALPRLGPSDVALADGLRLLAVGFVLAAGAGQARRAHARAAAAWSAAERQRVAGDLHDGLIQDLAFIAACGERFTGELGAQHPMVIAARRALNVSRGTIAELTDPPGASAEQALSAVAGEVGARFGIAATVDVEVNREPAADVRGQLSRITREAITNAARHGRAHAVRVRLRGTGSAMTLTIQDDGCGLSAAPDAGTPDGGFGLSSIRARATALGGTVTIAEPSSGGGTMLKVVLR